MPRTIPKLVSPAYVIRQRALYRGVLGRSRGWRLVALVVFGGGLFRKFVGKRPDDLGTEKLRAGQSICITALPPESRRRTRRRDVVSE